MFDEYGNFTGEIPQECVNDCTAIGECLPACQHWQEVLNFDCERQKAIDYLIPFGAWDEDELQAKTDKEISQIVLWLACADIKESGEWFGLMH